MWSTTLDPEHRLVADTLKAEWNDKLRALETAQQDYERYRQADRRCLDEEQRAHIRALAQDVPRLWHDPHTPARERKRLVRLLIEDVTLLKDRQVNVQLRFKTGRTQTLSLPLPKNNWQLHLTDPALIAEIDRLLEDYTDAQVAERLKAHTYHSGTGRVLHAQMVARLRRDYGLPSRYQRLRERGLLTQYELATRWGIHPATVQRWRRQGRLVAHRYSDKPEFLYEDPGENAPLKYQNQRHGQKPDPAFATVSAPPAPEVFGPSIPLCSSVR